jgi:Ring finger domain
MFESMTVSLDDSKDNNNDKRNMMEHYNDDHNDNGSETMTTTTESEIHRGEQQQQQQQQQDQEQQTESIRVLDDDDEAESIVFMNHNTNQHSTPTPQVDDGDVEIGISDSCNNDDPKISYMSSIDSSDSDNDNENTTNDDNSHRQRTDNTNVTEEYQSNNAISVMPVDPEENIPTVEAMFEESTMSAPQLGGIAGTVNALSITTPSTNSNNNNEKKTIGYYLNWVLRQICIVIKFLLLCPIALVVNMIVLLLLCIYITVLLFSACFCPTCLERIIAAEHRYTQREIQTNLIRRECLNVSKWVDLQQNTNDDSDLNKKDTDNVLLDKKLVNKIYELKTARRKILFSKPLVPKQTKSKQSKVKQQTRNKDINTSSDGLQQQQQPLENPPRRRWRSLQSRTSSSSLSCIVVNDDPLSSELDPVSTIPPAITDIETGIDGPNEHQVNTENQIANTSTVVAAVVNDNESDDDMYDIGEGCDICMIPYDVGDIVTWSRNPKCNHIFHEKCITEWISGTQRKKTCPCCRNDYIYEIEKTSKRRGRQQQQRSASASATAVVSVETTSLSLP